jgi:UDP-N-acetylglucosamine 4,6-dehydratase/5-epimerase
MLGGQSILVTGGTGSFGRAFCKSLIARKDVERIVVFSRDELKQFEMQHEPWAQDRRLRFFIGDVRDRERLLRAFEDVDVVVHAAALKQVPAAEYNPFEAIKTNVLGAQNVIEAALDRGVKRVVALSTDKAAAPINLYGATKLCSDKLFIAANNFKGRREIRFSVVRYGNVLGSRGSVVPFFLKKRADGALPITHPEMTRFNITLDDGVGLVMHALEHMHGGETFVPRIPSYRITDVAAAIAPSCKQEIVGIRPGEKLHEDLITQADAQNAFDLGSTYVVAPSGDHALAEHLKQRGAAPCPPGFAYTSGTNTQWLSVDEIRALIKRHVDPTFQPL